MNELAEARAFASILLDLGLSSASYIEHKLSTLASGTSPATRWAKRLVVLNLKPVDFGFGMFGMASRMNPNAGEQLQGVKTTVLECRDRYLLPAIRALKNVETVSLMGREGLDVEVTRALAELPRLQSLSLEFSLKKEDTVSLEAFSNLRILMLHSLNPGRKIPKSIRRMIARCPALDMIGISLGDDADEDYIPNLDTIFKASMRSPSFVPSLTWLRVARNAFTLSATSVPYLGSLQHLDIENSTGRIHTSFWKALTEKGVRIQSFAVYPLDVAAVQYLASYEGLTELHIRGNRRMEAQDCPEHLFAVLPQHQRSLRKLTLVNLDSHKWSITEQYLKYVLECQRLESLCLVYDDPDVMLPLVQEKLSPNMSVLLTRITESLLNLKELRVCPVRFEPNAFGYEMGDMRMQQLFDQEIGISPITCSRTPAFQLYSSPDRAFLSPPPLDFDPSSRCFRSRMAGFWF
ncbi:hypothetical protein MD484_g1980, partial [Candolleomyces efflorescens]